MGLLCRILLLGLGLAVVAPPSRAGEDRGARDAQKAADRLKGLSPKQKRLLLERLERWKKMSEEEKKRIRENLQTLQSLPGKERRDLEGNLEKWKRKEPAKRREIRKRLDEWRDLSTRRKDSFLRRHRLFSNLSRKERDRILALSEEQRRKALAGLFLKEEVRGLTRKLAPRERNALKGLDLQAQKKRALEILKARARAHLARAPESMRATWMGAPPKERAKAENRFLRRIHAQDQMVSLVLPSKKRGEFARTPISERDAFTRRFLETEPEKLLADAPAGARSEWEEAPAEEKPKKLLLALFQKRLGQVQAELLPSQKRGMRPLSLEKQWEKTQYCLKVNHRRLLSKLPPELRARIQPLNASQQARKVREYVRKELRASPATPLQRYGIQQLPLLLQWDAVQRLKRHSRGR